ncbi:MAG: hypothetical protein NZ455_01895 [Bacteroidia bacterium]|nr:hypothetical protein [Bacteroidia bacterium]MDW8348498.1 hypothetical protein [Bacteroidia bacterium]
MREGHGARALALCETKCSTAAKRSAQCPDPSASEGHAQKSKKVKLFFRLDIISIPLYLYTIRLR